MDQDQQCDIQRPKQSSGDEGIVLRLYVDSWSRRGDVEAAEKEALKRYRLNAGDRDRVEVVETLQKRISILAH